MNEIWKGYNYELIDVEGEKFGLWEIGGSETVYTFNFLMMIEVKRYKNVVSIKFGILWSCFYILNIASF